MDTFGPGKSLPIERVGFSLYHLSSLSKFKKYSDSTQTFAIAEPMFDLTQIMFGF